MVTHATTDHRLAPGEERELAARPGILRLLVPVGRIAFAAIFVTASLGLFSTGTIDYAAAHGVPLAGLAVPLSGVLALLGGLSVALGYRTRAGAWMLVAFLVPVTLMLHNFWTVTDAGARQIQQVMFMKNLSMLGGALLLAYFGAGPVSFDAWRQARAARR